MSQELIRLSTESTEKLRAVIRRAQKDLGMILVKSWFMAVGSIIPIVAVSALAGLLTTSFPLFAGFITAILIQVRYVGPKTREVGAKYDEEIKAIIEEERRRQAEGR